MQPPSAGSISVPAITADLITHLECAYTTMDPIARRTAIVTVEHMQRCDTNGILPLQLAEAALAVMQNPSVSPPTRAYGAVILRQLMVNHALSAADSHYTDILTWVVGADDSDDCYAGRLASPLAVTGPMVGSSIHRVVISASSQLVGTATALTWPQSAPNLIEQLCGADGSLLANRRSAQRLLLELCRSCCEPNFAALPKQRIGPLRGAIKAASPMIVSAAVKAIERQYVYLRQVTSTAEWRAAALTSEADPIQAVCEDMSTCVEILSLAARTCDPMLHSLWSANVDHALGALIVLDGSALISSESNNNNAAHFGGRPAPSAAHEAMSKVPLIALDACVAIIGNVSHNAVFPKEANQQQHNNNNKQQGGGAAAPTSSSFNPQEHAVMIQRLSTFCINVVSTMHSFVARREMDAVQRLVEVACKSPSMKNILAAAAVCGCDGPLSSALLGASVLALQVPNVAMATDICEALSERLQSAIAGNNNSNVVSVNGAETIAAPPAMHLLSGFEPDRCLVQLSQFAVRDHFNAWTPFVPRHTQQDTDYQSEGRRTSELVCDNSDAFMATYSQLRSAMAPLCAAIAALYPTTMQQFVAYILAKLSPPAPSDPRSPTNNVTQRSATYATWDSVEYLLSAVMGPTSFTMLLKSNDHAAGGGNGAVTTEGWLLAVLTTLKATHDAVFGTPTSDATLAPVFMNMLQHVWAVCLPSTEFLFLGIPKRVQLLMNFSRPTLSSGPQAATAVASEAIQYLFSFMKKQPTQGHILADPDLVSARKRSMTLLIRFCSSFAPGLCAMDTPRGHQVARLIKAEAEKSLIADKVLPSERSLLNEALAGLTNVMSAEDAEASTKALLGPSVDTLRSIGTTITTESLAALLSDDSRSAQAQRDTLRDSVSTLTAVLRRSAVNPFSCQIAATIIPLLGSVTLTVHALSPSHLPEHFAGILDPTDDEQKQAMINGSGVRRPPDLNNRIGNMRRYFAALRIALYQGIALLPRFLPVEHFTEGITQILVGAEHFSTPTMRDLCEQCLFPVTAECPSLITVTLRALQGFLYQRAQARSTEKQQIVDAKQMTYFCKDIASYIRATLVEGKRYQDIQKGPPIEGPSYQSNAMALVGSATAAYPCLASDGAMELFASSVCSLLSYGGEVRSASYLAMIAINEALKRDPSLSASPATAEACVTLFAVAAASTITNPSVDRTSTRDYILSMLSDLYVQHFPSFSTALTLSNRFAVEVLRGAKGSIATAAEVENLHSHLMAVKGPRQKRQCFVDFIVKCLGAQQQQ